MLFGACVLTTVFSYVQPYKSRFANWLDSLLWVTALALFLMSIPEPFHTFEIRNGSSSASECSEGDSSVSIFTNFDYLMIVCYYLPLIALVVATIGPIVITIFRCGSTLKFALAENKKFLYALSKSHQVEIMSALRLYNSCIDLLFL